MDFSKLKFFIDTIQEASNVLVSLMVKPSLKYDDVVNSMSLDSSLFVSLNSEPERWCDEVLQRLKAYNTDYLKYDLMETPKADTEEKLQKFFLLLSELDTRLKRWGMYDPDKYYKLISQTTNNDAKSNELIPKIAGVFYQMMNDMENLNSLFDDVQENIKKINHNPKVDKRSNVIDFFNDISRMDEVKNNVEGKTGVALSSAFINYIKNGVMKNYPSYGSLVKDWGFPDDKRLENNYKQAKKNTL